MPLSLLNHSALALFAQRTRIPTSARSIGFCAIWVCISSSSSSLVLGLGVLHIEISEISISTRNRCAFGVLLGSVGLIYVDVLEVY